MAGQYMQRKSLEHLCRSISSDTLVGDLAVAGQYMQRKGLERLCRSISSDTLPGRAVTAPHAKA